jgi:hypothetical protein
MTSWTIASAAALTATHSIAIKVLLSFTLRLYQYLEHDEKRKESIEKNQRAVDFQKAQLNEAEFAPMIALLAFYLSLNENFVENPNIALGGASLAAFANILYVWFRAVFGYPNVGIVTLAVSRYLGMVLMMSQIWKVVHILTDSTPIQN